jgi:hypothetical protein
MSNFKRCEGISKLAIHNGSMIIIESAIHLVWLKKKVWINFPTTIKNIMYSSLRRL